MESQVTVRKIKKNDIPAVANIRILGWQTAYKKIVDNGYLNSLNVNEIIENFEKNYLNGGFIIAEKANEIVGFCRYSFDNSFSPNMQDIDCELIAIYVRPDKKYMGIGKRLFEFVINEFYQNNKNKMIVWCLKDNEPSIDFYKKLGGFIKEEKKVIIGSRKYIEVGIVYNIKNLIHDKS